MQKIRIDDYNNYYTRAITKFTVKNGVDMKAEFDAMFTGNTKDMQSTVVRSCIRDNVYYAAIRYFMKDKEELWVQPVVAPYEIYNKRAELYKYCVFNENNIEIMNYLHCPKVVLQYLSNQKGKYGEEWRRLCTENATRK